MLRKVRFPRHCEGTCVRSNPFANVGRALPARKDRILGKNEVASSNLTSSFIKVLEPQQVLGLFFFGGVASNTETDTAHLYRTK